MGDVARLTAAECRARIQQIDKDLANTIGYGTRQGRLIESRWFFERALDRCLKLEARRRRIGEIYEQSR